MYSHVTITQLLPGTSPLQVAATCVTLTPYIKGLPGTLYCVMYLYVGIYLSARPLAWESCDRHTLLGKGESIYISHAQIGYVWENTLAILALWMLYISHTHLLGMKHCTCKMAASSAL